MGAGFLWTQLDMTVRNVVLGMSHACALSNKGAVKCWGWNDAGQLGLGDSRSRGGSLGEMADELPPVDLGGGRSALSLSTGDAHTCAVLDDHTLKCWGDNQFGQLGLGDARNRGTRPGEMGDALTPVDLGSNRTIQMVAAGAQHTCALLDNGAVKCWGANVGGVLGNATNKQVGDEAVEMGANLKSIELPKESSVSALFASEFRNCVVFTNGKISCWGADSYGELGPSPVDAKAAQKLKGRPREVNVSSSRKVTSLALGFSHTCALLDDGSAKCWGDGDHGALGYGSIEGIGRDGSKMGDNLPTLDFGTACALHE
jgi:alpha-tubulin suppressor-like RCC1 family protein